MWMMKNKTRCVIITAMHDADIDNPIATSVEVSETDYIVCADGGYDYAVKENIIPDIVIGDFDSTSISEVEAKNIEYLKHGEEKDDTDTMLCVKHAISKGFEHIVIIGGIGGSFGHTMANVQSLSYLTDMECDCSILTPKEILRMLDGETIKITPGLISAQNPPAELIITGQKGQKFSILSYAERTTGVCIENAKYLLDNAVLTQSFPLGSRNEFINNNPVTLGIEFGRLLIVVEK